MVDIPSDDSDDPQFIELAERVINGEAALVSAEVLHIVRIDSWFGDRWYSFAGKLLGAVEVHFPERLRVPPFHPHRVVSEARFRLTDPPAPVTFNEPFHTRRPSESNYHRAFGTFGWGNGPSCGAWFSGSSAASGRGSIMVYTSTPRGKVGWYAGLERRKAWDVMKLVAIDRRHWLTLAGSPAAAR